jgi:hypothetical protein
MPRGEEEQPGGIFAQAKKGEQDLDALGDRLKARKAELEGRPRSKAH